MGFKKVKLIGGPHRCPVLVGLNIIVFIDHCIDLFIFALHIGLSLNVYGSSLLALSMMSLGKGS